MDSVDTLFAHIDEKLYRELKTAVELGRWQSDNSLTDSQKRIALRAIIHFENRHLPPEQHTAYIYRPEHDACESSHDAKADEEQPVKFK